MIIIFMGSKGGIGKSLLAKMFYKELSRRGHRVGGKDSDPQQHFRAFLDKQTAHDNTEFTIVDTQGAWTTDNESLLTVLHGQKYKIIVPVRPSDDDVKEALTMAHRIERAGAIDNTVFVMNATYRDCDQDAREFANRIRARGYNVSKWQFQNLKGFAKLANTGKPQKQIQRFLHEQGI